MIWEEKQILRAKMKALVRCIPSKATASQRLRQHLLSSTYWNSAAVVFGFAPLAGEPDWLGDQALKDKLLAYPKIGDDGRLLFLVATSFERGSHGVREPVSGTAASAPDLVLVPGLAFDFTGARLGRGKGFYDRWLSANPGVKSVGLCFKCQVLENVPAEPHDARVQAVLTEEGFVVP
ncbi:MAG TPA: 5-formyltetrahydrofolate cyclo-ligase [Terrimicrobiaceae bacterium]